MIKPIRILSPMFGSLVLLLTFGCSSTQTVGEEVDDATITTKVEAKLTGDSEVSAYNVDVDTNDGVVRLSGEVEKPEARAEAEKLARDTEGVRRVINDITVGEGRDTGRPHVRHRDHHQDQGQDHRRRRSQPLQHQRRHQGRRGDPARHREVDGEQAGSGADRARHQLASRSVQNMLQVEAGS